MKKILVLCTGNSCRSQMAEGYLRYFAGDKATVYSAGTEIHGVNPMAIATMQEDGIDISKHTSNALDEYLHLAFDYVLTVCDRAQESCPVFPGTAQRLHHNFPDPAGAKGSAAEVATQFRHTRNLIRDYCRAFVTEHL